MMRRRRVHLEGGLTVRAAADFSAPPGTPMLGGEKKKKSRRRRCPALQLHHALPAVSLTVRGQVQLSLAAGQMAIASLCVLR